MIYQERHIPSDGLYLALWPVPRLIPALGPRPTMEAIVWHVANKHGLHPKEVRQAYGTRNHTEAQQEAMWTCYQTGSWSSHQIGLYFGGRHHSTVIHARRRHEARLAALGEWKAAA